MLADNAVIPIERTQVPTEWDQLRDSVANIISKLGPTPEQPKGPFGDVIESYADGLAGKGKQINTTLNSLSRALTALNKGRGDFFAVAHSLALFVNALHKDDQQFVALNTNLAQFTGNLTSSDQELANAIQQFDGLLTTVRPFLDKNREVLTHDINNLADRDHHAGAARAAEWFGDRPARPPDAEREPQRDLPPVTRRGHVHSGDPELHEPDAVPLQHDSGR